MSRGGLPRVRCVRGNDIVFLQEGGTAGRCGERTERCQWQKQRSERVAAVKIGGVRRKAAQKFWVPQQDHRPLRGVQGVQWAGDRKGRPYGGVAG